MDIALMSFTIHRNPEPDRLIVMGGQKPPVLTEDQGRVNNMADEKKLGTETGVKKIHQERPDKQGPVGTGADRTPEREPDADVKIGNKGDEKNG